MFGDPFDLEKLQSTIKEELAADEPSVIVVQRPCALLKNVKFPGPVKIDTDKCKRCKACLKLGCSAISDKGDHIEIDQTLCNGCGLCSRVCKFDAIH